MICSTLSPSKTSLRSRNRTTSAKSSNIAAKRKLAYSSDLSCDITSGLEQISSSCRRRWAKEGSSCMSSLSVWQMLKSLSVRLRINLKAELGRGTPEAFRLYAVHDNLLLLPQTAEHHEPQSERIHPHRRQQLSLYLQQSAQVNRQLALHQDLGEQFGKRQLRVIDL